MGKAAVVASATHAHTMASRLGLAAAALLVAAGGAVSAEEVGVTNTDAYTESLSFNPATITTNSTSIYSTQVIGRLQGGAPLYDQLFAAPFANPLVQAGLSGAYAAVTAGGGPGVVIGAPQLTASSTNTTSTSVTEYSLVSSVQEFVGVVIIFGPDVITVGQLSACGVSSLPSTTAPTCTTLPGTPYVLAPGETDGQTIWNTVHAIDQDTTVTETTTIFEQYTITGVVQAVGVVHTALQSGAYDASSRFLRRLGNEAWASPGPIPQGDGGIDAARFGWAEVYGSTASTSADGAIPGDRRTSAGLAGGVTLPVLESLALGFGIDHGRTSVDLDSAFAESGTIELIEIGLNAGFRSGPWFANLAATYGSGDADTTHAGAGVSTAGYDIRTRGVLAEAGYRFDVGAVRLMPSLGLDYVAVRADGFTEAGGLALTAPDHSTNRSRAWLGLDIGHTWQMGSGGSFDLSGYGRLVGVLSGEERLLPVAFAAGGAPMMVTGNAEESVGFDLGLKAAYDFGNGASLSAAYDGRFRDGFGAHAGILALKVSF